MSVFKNIKLAFDIGAYDGGYSNGLVQKGVSNIVCVEPNPYSFTKLQEKFSNNSNITLVNKAASTKNDQTVPCYLSKRHPPISTTTKAWTKSSRFANNHDESGVPYKWDEQIDVTTVNIDTLIKEHGVPDFIKIDTEGCEDEVIKGLTEHHENLTITFEFAEEFIDRVRNALKYLNDIGYNNVGIVEGDAIDSFPVKYHTYDAFMSKMDEIFPTSNKQFFGMVFVKG